MRGPPPPQLRWSTLVDALSDASVSDRPWLIFHRGPDQTAFRPSQLLELSLRWAHAFRAAGVDPGGRVGVLLPNGPEFIGAFFGAMCARATAVPLPWPVVEGAPERSREALLPIITRSQLSALATTPQFATVGWPTKTVVEPSPQTLREGPAASDSAFIQFTSGSTSDPKGAVISHQAALMCAQAMAQALELEGEEIGVSWLPFFHDMGLVGVLLTSLVGGFPVHVLRPAEFLMRPRRWLEVISAERATLTVGPNFGYELAVKRVKPEGLDLRSLRRALNGSEPIHRSTLDGFARTFAPAGFSPWAFVPVYGLAEATLGVTFCRPNTPCRDLTIDGRAVPSVGAPIAGLEIAIKPVGGTDSAARAPGEGEICVRGPGLMTEYFNHPEATEKALRDGWLHTGDLGVARDGVLYVTGREKELVIQAGRKFHPYDIERVVSELVDTTPNGVAAISRAHAATGSEELIVLVELRRQSSAPDPLSIRGELLRVLGVRADRIEFVGAGTLPRTTSGKVKRSACVPQAEAAR